MPLIRKISPFKAGIVLAPNQVKESLPIPLKDIVENGLFSIHNVVTGNGTCRVSYKMGNGPVDDGSFATPEGASPIIASQTIGSKVASFKPTVATYIIIVISEIGGANSVTCTTILNLQ